MPNTGLLRRKLTLATLAILSLVCSRVNSEAMGGTAWMQQPQEPIVVVRCPVRKNYSPGFLKQAGSEVSGLIKQNPQSPTANMLNDYRGLRRACDAIEHAK